MILNTDIEKLTGIAVNAAIKAGKEILNIYNKSDFEIELKPDKSPLTIADKTAHQIITDILNPTEIPVLSEEGKFIPYSERKNWKQLWMVDPLDGTKEFIKRNEEFTVNIALIENGSPVAGVVYIPVGKVIYWGNKSGSLRGIFDAEKEVITDIRKLPLKETREFFVIAGSKSHMNKETETFIQSVNTNGKPVKIISRGSSLKICMIAAGEADIYPRLAPTMEWDTAAAHAIVKFAGKNVYQLNSHEPLVYNKENLLNPWFVAE